MAVSLTGLSWCVKQVPGLQHARWTRSRSMKHATRRQACGRSKISSCLWWLQLRYLSERHSLFSFFLASRTLSWSSACNAYMWRFCFVYRQSSLLNTCIKRTCIQIQKVWMHQPFICVHIHAYNACAWVGVCICYCMYVIVSIFLLSIFLLCNMHESVYVYMHTYLHIYTAVIASFHVCIYTHGMYVQII